MADSDVSRSNKSLMMEIETPRVNSKALSSVKQSFITEKSKDENHRPMVGIFFMLLYCF